MKKQSRLLVLIMLGITLILGIVAIVVGINLSQQDSVDPEQSEASEGPWCDLYGGLNGCNNLNKEGCSRCAINEECVVRGQDAGGNNEFHCSVTGGSSCNGQPSCNNTGCSCSDDTGCDNVQFADFYCKIGGETGNQVPISCNDSNENTDISQTTCVTIQYDVSGCGGSNANVVWIDADGTRCSSNDGGLEFCKARSDFDLSGCGQVAKSCTITHGNQCVDGGKVRINWDANPTGFNIDNTDAKVIIRLNNQANPWFEDGDVWWATDFAEYTGNPAKGTFDFSVEDGQSYDVRASVVSPAEDGPEICTTGSPTFTCSGVVPVCGDGICNQASEQCDTGIVCPGGGSLPDGAVCRGVDDAAPCSYCGDGRKDPSEECEPDLDENCSTTCEFEEEPEVGCNNNICDEGETCDGDLTCPGEGSLPDGVSCRASCSYCGDGVKDPGEFCDDGNNLDGDDCNSACFIDIEPPVSCGDGVTDPGEECDDGNTNGGDGCSAVCTVELNLPTGSCGDGILQVSEQCDTGIQNSCGNGAECRSGSCTCEPLPGQQCGSQCRSNAECVDQNNVCFSGRCMLAACVPSSARGILSSPLNRTISDPFARHQSEICSKNGCEIVACGGECGEGSLCPSPLMCDKQNKCVLPACLNNSKCQDVCIPPMAIISDEVDLIIFSLLLILVGVLAYRVDLLNKGWDSFKFYGGNHILAFVDKNEAKLKLKKNRKKSNVSFEGKFKKKKRKS